MSLTIERLKILLHYDEKSGLFTRKINKGKGKAGDIVGSTQTNGYLQVCIDGKLYYLHRIAWLYVYGEWPNEIDHIDRNVLNNSIDNLRDVSHGENCKNRIYELERGASIYGVYWDKVREKWQARLMIEGKFISLGRYIDWFEAVCARKSAEHKHRPRGRQR